MLPISHRACHGHFWLRHGNNLVPMQLWNDSFEEAKELVTTDVETNIQGYDIDGEIIRAARDNAKRAGVDHLIHFQQRPVSETERIRKNMVLSLPIRLMENV